MSRRRGRAARLTGVAALIMLLVLMAGLPLLLYRLGGSPVPRHFPGWQHIGRALLHRDSGAVFLAAVRDISWLAWAAFTIAVLAEAQAALRGRAAPRLRLGGLESAAGHLVALALLTFTAPSTMLLAVQPAASVTSIAPAHPAAGHPVLREPAAGRHDPQDPASGLLAGHEPRPPDPEVMSMGFYQLVTVRPGDCLWTIAQRYLGDGDRYQEIVKLNLGHDMGGGRQFTDPSVIWPGWVLQLPAGGSAPPHRQAQHSGSNGHGAHPSREHRFRRPHPAASHGAGSAAGHHAGRAAAGKPSGQARGLATAASPAPASAVPPAAPGAAHPAAPHRDPARSPAPAQPAAATPAPGTALSRHPDAAGTVLSDTERMPTAAVFAAGMLAGGAAVALARMRHRQRQVRRPGRRIPLPVSAPVMEAERRIRAEPDLPPATALRAVLRELGFSLAAAGHQIPEITAIEVTPSGLEVLLASPASEPPPAPFTVPGGRQGMAWHLSLPAGGADQFPPPRTGDLLPGLFTVGVTEHGYLLLDLEYLRVTTVEGPADLAGRVLTTAAAELATSELAGWYELILVGFPEVAAAGGRVTSCDSLDEALDLLTSRAVALRRRLGSADQSDVRQHRLTAPDDEDWALTLLVSRTAPAPGQFALLLDLCGDLAGLAALIPGGSDVPAGHPAPASIELTADPGEPGGMTARVWPLGLQAWPQPMDATDYQALASLFATAAQDDDVAPDAPPYDGSSWLPWQSPTVADLQPADDMLADGEMEQAGGLLAAGDREPADLMPDSGALAGAAELAAGQEHADPQPSLRIGVLGSFTLNGAPAALLPAQSQLVLALALNGQDGLSNQQLCYLLGADPDHPRPSDSLRQLIVRTRRQLGRLPDGREWIEHLGSGQYALHPAARFDWAEFDELAAGGIQARDADCLRAALGLIRGQPFTGCYHWWLDPALTETVRAQIVDAAEMLAELELAGGDPGAAARAARTGLAGDAGAEQLWRALMRAEHAAGNLTGVRDAWSRCLDAIAEIAADGQPHPRTAALYRELLAGADPRPAWSRG